MNLCCQQDDRRDAVRCARGLNGLDYVEVSNDQLTLAAFFLGKLPPELATEKPGLEKHLQIEGGQRVTDLRIISVKPVADEDPEKDDQLLITLDKYGDFSTYTLRLVGVENIDPRYDRVHFGFKINCPSDLDCAPSCHCESPALEEPEINYLAKDYASFRQLILDRLSLLAPDWKERHVPDLGMTLVEILAYAGDHLSYFQDAVATEAYLDTARQRISVRRHARLVDYRLHEGCNARAWLSVQTDTDFALDPVDASFITDPGDPELLGRAILNWSDLGKVPVARYEVFEVMSLDEADRVPFYAAHSEIRFYTWGRKKCCLERGATTAVLREAGAEAAAAAADQLESAPKGTRAAGGRQLHLKPGDVLIFEEVVGPITGNPADADPAKRHVVRLTKVTPGRDELFNQPVVEIEWNAADALPFPLCLSAIGAAPDCKYLDHISVARGNVILVDHGKTFGPEDLGRVPTLRTQAVCECADHPGDLQNIPGPFHPRLAHRPLTFSEALPSDPPAGFTGLPASSLLTQDVRAALPQAWLQSEPEAIWEVTHDLIRRRPVDRAFAVEVDNDGVAQLRFGDGELGCQPPAGMTFDAHYRVGNGVRGNIGAETLTRLVLRNTTLSGITLTIRNPFPASGGTDPEPVAMARLLAPYAFRDPKQIQRAITAEDYALIAERNAKVQRAAAALVWTGSWYEADVGIDPRGGESTDPDLLAQVTQTLERARRIGHDLHVLPARYVPLDLKLEVCALPQYQRGHVKAALLETFSDRILAGGRRGFFHPDNLTFGEGVYLSRIIAAAQSVAGVECVKVVRCQRLFAAANDELEAGLLRLRVNEVAQLAADPNFPEHGKLEILVKGGR